MMNRLLGKVRATKLTHGSRDRKRKEQEKQKHSNGRVQVKEAPEMQESVSSRKKCKNQSPTVAMTRSFVVL